MRTRALFGPARAGLACPVARHCAAAAILGLLVAPAQAFGQRCPLVSAEIIGVEGRVEWQPQTAIEWQVAALGAALCEGDRVRVAASSRAALRLADETVLRLDANTVLHLAPAEPDGSSWVELLRGIIHVISRDPRSLTFRTPYANAGLEGTEFLVAADAQEASVTVLEGVVKVSNGAGQVSVGAGHRAAARGGAAPVATAVAEPFDAARWTFFYAPVLDARPGARDAEERADPQLAALREVARLLEVGQIDAATGKLDGVRANAPGHPTALALAAVIALKEGATDRARALAEQALASDPESAAALLALSHVQQARFEIEAANATLSQAAEQHPENPLVWTRLAELELSRGRAREGRTAAERALALDPASGYAHTMHGFAWLRLLETAEAEAAFERAIALDQSLPLARLGAGLAWLTRGDLAAARRELEIAVLLDPANALIRSYAGKVYYDERRAALSETQLAMAKALDPDDPTAWVYDAVLKLSRNRPAEALQHWQRSVELSGADAQQRSRLLLDEDLGTRSASVARIYRDLGFEQLALADAWQALNRDPTDYSAHRLLADSYGRLPLHQIARINELYQSQLLQPFQPNPVAPQLAQTGLFLADQLGPMDAAFPEFNPLLARRRFAAEGAAITAGNGTSGGHVAAMGVHERVNYSVGYFGYETDGFRANNDFDSDVRSAFLQLRPNERHSIQLELRASDIEKGDLRLLFDPSNFSSALRQAESVDRIKLSGSRRMDEGTILASVTRQESSAEFDTAPVFSVDTALDDWAYELAYLHDGSRWDLQTGFSYLERDQIDVSNLQVSLPFPPFAAEITETLETTVRQLSLYSYAQVAVSETLTATVGGSLDRLDGQLQQNLEQFNPKLGLTWRLRPDTTLRLAAMRTLQGPFVSKQNILPRLEPTQVAGFNQFYFGSEGEDARRVGIGVDHIFQESLFAGAEVSRRDLDTPVTLVLPGNPVPTLTVVPVEAAFWRAYVYWMPTRDLALGSEYLYERFDNNGQVLIDGFAKLTTHRFPLRIKYFAPSGLSAGLSATYVHQYGDFGGQFFGTEEPTTAGEDRFWAVDASLGYRLPNRRGQLSLGVYNMFDRTFRFQDTDPESPTIMPERLLAFRFTLAY